MPPLDLKNNNKNNDYDDNNNNNNNTYSLHTIYTTFNFKAV
jgi:hypothetical protein